MPITQKSRGKWVVGDLEVLDDLIIDDDVTITGDIDIAGTFEITPTVTASSVTTLSIAPVVTGQCTGTLHGFNVDFDYSGGDVNAYGGKIDVAQTDETSGSPALGSRGNIQAFRSSAHATETIDDCYAIRGDCYVNFAANDQINDAVGVFANLQINGTNVDRAASTSSMCALKGNISNSSAGAYDGQVYGLMLSYGSNVNYGANTALIFAYTHGDARCDYGFLLNNYSPNMTAGVYITETAGATPAMTYGLHIDANCTTAIHVGASGSPAGDIIFYGTTAGNYFQWDDANDDLLLVGTSTQLAVAGTTNSSSTTTGSIHTAGGLGVALDVFIGGGELNVANAATDIVIKANTAAALEIYDSATKLVAIDTRNTVSGVEAIAFNPGAGSVPDGAASTRNGVVVKSATTTLLGTTGVTTPFDGLSLQIEVPTIAQSGGAVTVDKASTVYIEGPPTAGASVTLSAPYALEVESGVTLLGGNLKFDGALDVVVDADTDSALEFYDATTKFIDIDTRVSADNTSNITITGMPASYAAANGTTHRLLNLAPGTTTLTGSTAPTAMEGLGLYISQPVVTDASALVIGRASTVYIASSPGAADAASMTDSVALYIDTCTTALEVGPCTTGLNFNSTLGTGISFHNATFVPDANRTDIAAEIGSRANELTVNLANSASQNFDPVQINLNLTASGGAPTSTSTVNGIYQLINHDTADMSHLRLKGSDWTINAAKNFQDAYVSQNELDIVGNVTVGGEAFAVSAYLNAGAGTYSVNDRLAALFAIVSGTATVTGTYNVAQFMASANADVDSVLYLNTNDTASPTQMLALDPQVTTNGIILSTTGSGAYGEAIQVGGTYDHGLRFTEDPVAGDSDNSFINIGLYGTPIAVAPTSDNMFGTMHNVTLAVDVAYWYQAHYTKITTSGTTDTTSIAGHAYRMVVASDLAACYGVQSHVTLSGARTFTSEVSPGSFYLDAGTGSISAAGNRVNALQAVVTGGASVTADTYAVGHFYAATNAALDTLLAVQQNSTVTSTSAVKLEIDGTCTYAFDFDGAVPDAWTTGTAGTSLTPSAEYVLIPVDVKGTTNPLFILAAQTWTVV